MTAREIRLTAAVAAAGVLWLGSRGVSRYRDALEANEAKQFTAQEELAAAEFEAYRGQKARKQLHQWRRQSLPADVDVAESLYRDWLTGELKGAGVENPVVADRARASAGQQATELTFNVTGQGTLAQWLEFFRRFAAAPHLQRISEATLTPTDDRQKLTASLRVDALSLADSPRQKELAKPAADAPPADKLKPTIDAIAARNPFQPAAKKNANEGNLAAKAKVTFLFGGREGWIVDVRREDTGAVERFSAGDTVKFGTFEAKLIELDGRRVLYETSDGRFEVQLGQTFGEGTPVAKEEGAQSS